MTRSGLILLALSLPVFWGCSTHDVNYDPTLDINASRYSLETERNASVSKESWYRDFNDSTLNTLVETALKQNYDIKQAIARLNQSRAIAKVSEAAGMPTLDLEAGGSHRYEEDGTRDVYDVGVGLRWEIDLFDRLENAELADAMEAQARAEDLKALRLSLSGEVAEAYFGAMAARQRLALLEEQVKLDTEYLELVMLRFQNGVATTVEILQQKSQLAQSESLIPIARAELRRYENRLDVLLGEVPDGQSRVEGDTLKSVAMPEAVGVPSKLLTRRPDLRAQQRRLIAADAQIGAAIAGRLPTLTLGASYYHSESLYYSGPLGLLSASLIQPLVDWGARKARVASSRAYHKEQIARYGSLYLQAIEEVENALYLESQQRDYLERLEARAAVLRLTVEEAQAQYLQGLGDYLTVLSALEALHATERQLITARYALISYRITLYRAIGSDVRLPQLKPKETTAS